MATRRTLLKHAVLGAFMATTHGTQGRATTELGTPDIQTLLQQASAAYHTFTSAANTHAQDLLAAVLRHEPHNIRALILLAASHRQDANGMWSDDAVASELLAYGLARLAVRLARQAPPPQAALPAALEQLGWVLLYREQHAEALQVAREAVAHTETFANGYALWAHVLIYQGQPEAALAKSQEAMDRSMVTPHPFFYDYHRGQAFWVWGALTLAADLETHAAHFACAEAPLRLALEKNPNFRPARSYLAATLYELGRVEEAVDALRVSLDKGEPLAQKVLGGHGARAEAHIRRLTPYAISALRARFQHALLALGDLHGRRGTQTGERQT